MGGRVLHLTETSSSADLSSSLTNFSVTCMTMTLCYHLGGLFHRLPLLDVLHDQLVKHLLLDVLHDHLVTHPLLDVLHDQCLRWSLTTSSSTSSFPSLMSSMSCKSKPR